MKQVLILCAIGLLLPVLTVHTHPYAETTWGFFGHRRINRLAVFTLPPEMSGFYKRHIEYVTEHAVDPDKRRYATRHEAVRHYIDIDHWDGYPFTAVPRDWTDALAKHTSVSAVTVDGDTLSLFGQGLHRRNGERIVFENGWLAGKNPGLDYAAYRDFFQATFLPQYYEESWSCSCAGMETLLQQPIPGCLAIIAMDRFSEYGILPYHLPVMQRRLTKAFEERDPDKIIRLSTEMGHYIADAHVPLHTTENYNGQLTGQDGIHAFWESRLPELFADDQYDYFVGPAVYIGDPPAFFWDVVLSSHMLLDSVLFGEKTLSRSFPSDQQFCYEERLGQTVRTQCAAYAKAYHDQQAGQVEARMRASILAVGSAWYTAWVDAGSPDLQKWENIEVREDSTLAEKKAPVNDPKIRPHE